MSKKEFDFLRQEQMWNGMPVSKEKKPDIDPMPKWARVLIGLVVLAASSAGLF
jgi:hypothetical protein